MNALCLVVALTLSAAGDEPTLLAFTAPNCPACDAAKPAIDGLIEAGVPVETIDYVDQPKLCKQFRVNSFPTFVLIANGQEVDRIVGQVSYDRLAKLLARIPATNDSISKSPAGARSGEVVRGQSPDDAPQGLLGKTFGRLWGNSGGQNASRGGTNERRDPFAGRGRSGTSGVSAQTSDSEVEISRAPSSASESGRRRTPATPVSKSTEARTPAFTPDETIEEENATADAVEINRAEFVAERSSPSKSSSPRLASSSPANRLRGSSGKNVRAPADDDSYQPSKPAPTSEGGLSPQQRAIASTVRVKVIDSRGASDGSGVVIDTLDGEALIATCGHIFRESQGRGRIMIDLFIPGAAPVEGQLVEYNIERDIALVSMFPGIDVVTTPVAPAGYQFAQGDQVFSVGCQRGRGPELIESSITGINRYKTFPHIVVKGAPAQGRSGGGLFSEEGYLIGICNAADKQGKEGIFAGLPLIHGILDNRNLSHVYRQARPVEDDQDIALVGHGDPVSDDAEPEMERGMPDVNPTAFEADNESAETDAELDDAPVRNQREDKRAAVGPRGARLGEPVVEADEGEADIICIVRSRTNPTAQNNVLVIREATPELLAQLSQAAAPPPNASRPAELNGQSATKMARRPDQANRQRSGGSSLRPRNPVVRGQSMR
jgi:thiol-disulfide isomerase/thioredoxin